MFFSVAVASRGVRFSRAASHARTKTAADLLPSETRRAYVSELQALKTARHAGPVSARPAFVALAIIEKWTPQNAAYEASNGLG